MIIKNNLLKINHDFFKRKIYIKHEIKKIILKSIIQNKNLKHIIRSYAIYKLSSLPLKSSISKQNNNICIKTGRIKGNLKLNNLSRHTIKKISINNNLQNIKIIN